MSERELVSSIARYFKVKPRRGIYIAVALSALLYILVLKQKPHISVFGNSIDLELPAFTYVELNFLDSVPVTSYVLTDSQRVFAQGRRLTANGVRDANAIIYDRLTDSFQARYTNSVSIGSSNQTLYLHVEIGPTLHCDISGVRVDGREVNLRTVKDSYFVGQGDYVRVRYARRDLADFLFRANDVVSNFVLAFLGLFILVESVGLFGKVVIACYSEKQFRKHLFKSLELTDTDGQAKRTAALERVRASWWNQDERFRFLQALGPAVGFILTVSSLVQALHPASFKANNLDGFLAGIHIAMISTFLGLALRLVALWAARLSDGYLDRAEIYLDEKVTQTEGPVK